MVERFDGRISDILKTHHCLSGEDLAETLRLRLPVTINGLNRLLGSRTSAQTMHKWFISNPRLFHRKPDDQPGCDILRIGSTRHIS